MTFNLNRWIAALLLLPYAVFSGVLAFSPVGRDFNEAVSSLRTNLSDYTVTVENVNDDYSTKDMAKSIKDQNPEVVVLFDNKSIRLYHAFLDEYKPSNPPPVVALMALQIESSLVGIPNVIGISYEIPAVTTASRLRSLWSSPIRKVGVVYRASMEKFFLENQKFCKVEQIALVGQKISDETDDLNHDVRISLQNLVWNDQVDALWILNDNKLLSAKLIRDVWIPFMKSNAKPGIVGFELLAQTKIGVGVIAVLPDNVGLGAQAANLVYEIMDNGKKVETKRIDLPLAVIQVLNTTLAHRLGALRPDAEKLVDRVVE